MQAREIWPKVWSNMWKQSQLKDKQLWLKGKPKLNNARKLRGISYIDLEDMEQMKHW